MDSAGAALDDHLPSDRLLRATAAQWNAALVWASASGAIVGANPGFARLAGQPLDALVGRPLPALLDFGGRVWSAVWQAACDGRQLPGTGSLCVPRADPVPVGLHWQSLTDGGERLLMCEMRGFDEREHAGAVARLQQDVLELVATGRSLKLVLDFLCRQVEASAPDVICSVMLLDGSRHLRVAAAPSLSAGYCAEIDGMEVGPDNGCCGAAVWRGEPVVCTDIASDPRWTADGRCHRALANGIAACWSNPIKGRNAQVLGTFALFYREPRGSAAFHRRLVDACVHLCALAIEHDRARAEINRLAFFDTLTGLPNRQLLADRATAALALAGRTRQPVALMFLDIDRFKTVNDSLGHAVGDRLLTEVAERLGRLVLDGDTLARLGGDEFVLLLPGCEAAQAALLAERILAALSAPLTVADLVLTPTASIGIAVHPDDGLDFDTLMRQADAAMYRAKEAGRNRCHFFRQDINDQAVRRLEMEAALREALVLQESGGGAPFELHYQPQVSLDPRRLYRVEALVRWTHPRWGAVSPAEFVPLAEECGLIDRLDSWVLETAVAQLARWREAGVPVPGVAVNVSAARFARGDLPDHVRAVLATNGIPANDLTLEITERLMMSEEIDVHDGLDALHALGVTLSIDDFGTGYSSLGYLKRFPVTELKIDRSFVKELDIDAANRPLVRAIIQIGEALGLTVVAEGVERETQHRMLEAEGCAVGQGYRFARPMAAGALADWLQGEGRHWTGHQPGACISI
ncbi:putative bifunctional diguanylate cyclase/phosphodiesterase [Azospirillum picis]|uniref:Diguanylate cyclase (GGDEF)-like protein n=1 Tax=Azospirillum picis TaxID=488438 RepID=A0ABU0MPN1_9PROT|nr:EAL domain-containing protein [Azospirillum picis]MBP2301744.1 diguanylate cyclase (GGDEF)-like protein [Azospirillum picis]MDQ0535432.1 diguanylate cyclase (GGDEF)-like protein [Azospirillum picis]